jgi:hypothetical protein
MDIRGNEMQKRALFIGVLLVGLTIAATSMFWNLDYLTDVFAPKYVVHVHKNYAVPLESTNPRDVLVLFLKGNITVAECVVTQVLVNGGWAYPAQNITLSRGQYNVRLYNAVSGVYISRFEIYMDRELILRVPL